jgi:hypothetical protein
LHEVWRGKLSTYSISHAPSPWGFILIEYSESLGEVG